MNRAEDIYPLRRMIQRELEIIREDPNNSESLLRYYNTRVAEGISKARIHKCLNTMRKISERIAKPFSDATKDDFVKFVSELEQSNLADWTKRDYKIILKHFYKWFRNWEEGSPPEVRWIKKTRDAENKNPILPKDLLTKDEKLALLRETQNPRDRALLEIFYESGRRMEEILTLRIKDIEFDSIGAKLFINGKMGSDFARIISSTSSLAVWLDVHPARDNPESPVWVGLDYRTRLRQMSYAAARTMLRKMAQRAKIKKRVFFYLLRHTRIDETQGILTEPQQCMMFGWQFGSNMPKTYMKRYGKHIDAAQATMNGINVDKKENAVKQTKSCFRCKLENSLVSKFCNRCGTLLDVETANKIDETKSKIEELLFGIASDPNKINQLKNALQDICK